jgi:hypothetical protein
MEREMMSDKKTHPIQQIIKGRFVPNKIVQYLLDNGGINMNELAIRGFDDEDSQQFAQLIGYSVSGYASLSYVSDESYIAASNLEDNPEHQEHQARLESLRETIEEAAKGVKIAAEALFKIHPDDLQR